MNQVKQQSKLQVLGEKAPWDEELRRWLEKWMESNEGLSTADVARQIGVSRTMVDGYLQKKYFGIADPKTGKIRTTETSKMEPALRAYRARIEGPKGENSAGSFLKTTAWHQIHYACQTTIEENGIAIVWGAPGKGKTRCMIEFAFRKTRTAPVIITCSPNITTRYFVQKIAKELKLATSYTTAHLEDLIVEWLRAHPRPIIVDQANYLNPKGLGSISYIWDQARSPTVLFGTRTLKELFYSAAMTQDERAQLASRVSMQYQIDGLDLGTVKGLCERILGKEIATPAVVKTIFEKVGGKFGDKGDEATANFRALEFRLRRLAKLMKAAPDKPIEALLEQADRMLMAA